MNPLSQLMLMYLLVIFKDLSCPYDLWHRQFQRSQRQKISFISLSSATHRATQTPCRFQWIYPPSRSLKQGSTNTTRFHLEVTSWGQSQDFRHLSSVTQSHRVGIFPPKLGSCILWFSKGYDAGDVLKTFRPHWIEGTPGDRGSGI